MPRRRRVTAARWRSTPFATAIRAASAPTPTSRKGTDYAIQTCRAALRTDARTRDAIPTRRRSEEHTSELQSLMRISYAVFCLKKKNNKTKHNNQRNLTQKHNN